MSVVVISLSCLLTLNLDMFIIMFVCITLPHIAIVIMELSEIKDCIVLLSNNFSRNRLANQSQTLCGALLERGNVNFVKMVLLT